MLRKPESVLLVMALEMEARGVLEQVGSELLLTGVGKVNATYELTKKLSSLRAADRSPELVVNFGTAGSRTLPTGSMVGCTRFIQNDMDARGLGFGLGQTPFDPLPRVLSVARLFDGLPEGVCASADRFDTGQFEAAEPELPRDAIEMEAYALARVCALEGVRFGCAKYITDGADQTAATDWAAALPQAALAFVQLYKELLRSDA